MCVHPKLQNGTSNIIRCIYEPLVEKTGLVPVKLSEDEDYTITRLGPTYQQETESLGECVV